MAATTVGAMGSMYATNLAFVTAALLVLGASGWWAVVPLRRQFAYPLAQAPLAGMILVPLGTLAANVLLRLPFPTAALTAICALTAASVVAASTTRQRSFGEWRVPLAVAGAAAAGAVWFLTRTDLFFGSPGLVYAHGTDHLGYAHLADWLRLWMAEPARIPVPENPYGSWPQLMFAADPRFGSFAWLAVVSIFSGRSGAFAYDLASAIVFAAAAPGVAAVFARRPLTFAALAAGLFTSFWFDWNRGGYLGRTMSYPATIFLAGLFFAAVAEARRRDHAPTPYGWLVVLAALTAGAALFHSGILVALFLALLGVTFALASTLLDPARPGWVDRARDLRDPLLGLAILFAIAVLSTGVLSRPLYFDVGRLPWSWPDIFLRVTETEGVLAGLTGLPARVVRALALVVPVAWVAVALLTVVHRVPAAATALLAPPLLLGALVVANLRQPALIFTGIYVPLFLCGTAALADALAERPARRWVTVGVQLLLVAMVVSHLPRYAGTAAFHGGRATPPLFRFSSAETDALAAGILREGGTALVDTGTTPHFGIFLLVELGRRGIPLQWTPESWKMILFYRRWPVPTYASVAPLRIVVRAPLGTGTELPLVRTTQFDLLREP